MIHVWDHDDLNIPLRLSLQALQVFHALCSRNVSVTHFFTPHGQQSMFTEKSPNGNQTVISGL